MAPAFLCGSDEGIRLATLRAVLTGERQQARIPRVIAPLWLRVVMPSVTDLFFVATFLLLTLSAWAARLLWDTSTGWHIRNGERIIHTLTIPRTDPFSYTMAGQPWYAWEWLWDAFNGLLHQHFGLSGVVALTAVLIALTFAWLYRTAAERSGNVVVAAVLTLLALAASSIHFLARPHVVSWVFTLVVIRELDRLERDSRRALWMLPVVFAFWANLHGGFVFGLALITVYALAAALERQQMMARRLAGVFATSVIATVLNPYGLKLHWHILRYLASGEQMNRIDEFLSPNFHDLQPRLFLLLILTAVATLFAARQVRWKSLLVAVLAIATGLLAARNIPFASILLVYASAPLLADLLRSSPFQRLATVGERLHFVDTGFRGHLLPRVVVVALFGAFFAGLPLPGAHWTTARVPEKAAQYVVNTLGERDHVFAPDYWGGYLTYSFAQQGFRVAQDDRSDLYGDQRFRQYLDVTSVAPDWRTVMDDWQVRTALVPAESSLSSVLAASPNWKQVYGDAIATVFVRTQAEGAR